MCRYIKMRVLNAKYLKFDVANSALLPIPKNNNPYVTASIK